jgi:hypothetical protein|nr:MAG TPA: hypothetical protein [Herelleviridae sp.]
MVIGTITSSFSQTSYPKKILWGNDTVLAITKPQLITINRSLNDLYFQKKINKNLRSQIFVQDSLLTYWKTLSLKTDSLYLFENKKYEESCLLNSSLKKSLEKEKRRVTNIGIGVGVGGTLLGILIGVLLAK